MTAEGAILGVLAAVWLGAWGLVGGVGRLLWPQLERRSRGWHAADRGTWLLGLALMPIALPTLLVLAGIAPGLAGVLLPALDHCLAHPDHVHLCLVHPTAALPPLLAALVGGSTLLLVLQAAHRGLRLARLRRALPALAGRPGPALEHPGSVRVVDSARVFAWTVGWLRPYTLLSTALVRALDAGALEVVLAHEREHARRRDPLRRLLAGLGSHALGRRVRSELLGSLALAAEQACDEGAAGRLGDRLRVARALVSVEALARREAGASGTPEVEGIATGIADGSLPARVEALLAAPRPRRPRPPRLLGAGLGVALLLSLQAIHHTLEHLITFVVLEWVG